jgi:hypothetical protein
MPARNPILLAPYFFSQVLSYEKKNVARAVWYFTQLSLEKGDNEIPCSYTKLSDALGMNSDTAAKETLRECLEKGYLMKVDQESSALPNKYGVCWDFLGDSGTEKRMRKAYKVLNEMWPTEENPITYETEANAKLSARERSVNKVERDEGKRALKRFEDKPMTKGKAAFEQEDWKGHGTPDRFVQNILGKIEGGKFSSINAGELWRYFQWKYQKHFKVKYLGNQGLEIKRIRERYLIEDQIRREDIIKMIDWLCSDNNRQFDTPNINLLGTQWRQTIYDKAMKSNGRPRVSHHDTNLSLKK